MTTSSCQKWTSDSSARYGLLTALPLHGDPPTMEAQALAPRDFYAPARQHLDDLIADLKAPDAFTLQEARIEEMVVHRGREVLRTLLQGFFDARAHDRPVGPVVGKDSLPRTQVRPDVERDLQTQVGPVIVTRVSFGTPGQESLRPLDAALNLPPTLYSFPLGKLVAAHVAFTSFEQTQKMVTQQTGVTIGWRQVEEEAQRAAVDFQAFYEQRQQAPLASGSSRPSRSRTGGLLILSADGKGVVMRTQALREATRCKAEAAAKSQKRRLSAPFLKFAPESPGSFS